ncbi:MAG: RNA pseudouridine synthase [Parachlamydiaceae bacterium]
MEVIYEDNHLLVVNKPAGVLTQPAGTVEDSLETRAKAWIKQKYQKPGNVFLGVVHRLDKPVSGIVVFAKTSKALSRLNEGIRSKENTKIYHALVEGCPKTDQGVLEHYLKHDDHCAYVCRSTDLEAKLARLRYRVLEKRNKVTLLEIVLETGRYHQIRCQCSAEGFPVVGDTKYGGQPTPNFSSDHIALHHAHLSLKHPITHNSLDFDSNMRFYAH